MLQPNKTPTGNLLLVFPDQSLSSIPINSKRLMPPSLSVSVMFNITSPEKPAPHVLWDNSQHGFTYIINIWQYS